jgi:hypothetical protein
MTSKYLISSNAASKRPRRNNIKYNSVHLPQARPEKSFIQMSIQNIKINDSNTR